jgi:hypothetical protein
MSGVGEEYEPCAWDELDEARLLESGSMRSTVPSAISVGAEILAVSLPAGSVPSHHSVTACACAVTVVDGAGGADG